MKKEGEEGEKCVQNMHCISFIIAVQTFQQILPHIFITLARSAPMQVSAQIVAILKTHLLLIMQTFLVW